MVFDAQCLITDRLASAFVGTLVSRTGRVCGDIYRPIRWIASEDSAYPISDCSSRFVVIVVCPLLPPGVLGGSFFV